MGISLYEFLFWSRGLALTKTAPGNGTTQLMANITRTRLRCFNLTILEAKLDNQLPSNGLDWGWST